MTTPRIDLVLQDGITQYRRRGKKILYLHVAIQTDIDRPYVCIMATSVKQIAIRKTIRNIKVLK